jgi:hypothetical protein
MKLRLPLAAIFAAAFFSYAHAAPVTYALNDVTFIDGASAVGSFSFNTTTDAVTAVEIALNNTSSGTIDLTSGSWLTTQQAIDGLQAIDFTDPPTSASLTIYVANFPSTGSAPLIIGPYDSYGTGTYYCPASGCGSLSHLIGYGSATTGAASIAVAVPEPASVAILFTGALMGLMARRRGSA